VRNSPKSTNRSFTRRGALVLAAALVPAAVLPGCTSGSQPKTTANPTTTSASAAIAGVTVAGAAGSAPTVSLADSFAPVSALAIKDLNLGKGKEVTPGAAVTVNYVGVGQKSRKVFDSSWDSGAPAKFPLTEVIEGWQKGIPGMMPGGRRLLVIPASQAYGAEGHPPVILPDETLVFVIDLISSP
jgi:peptidylprolyl isomerase